MHPRRRRILLSVALVGLLVGAGTGRARAETELAWDSGEQGGKQSSAGTGHVIAFEAPKGSNYVTAVRIHGARYGGGYDPGTTTFRVAVCDDHLVPITSFEAPYALFAPGAFTWVEVPLPRVVPAPDRFKVVVAFDPSSSRGVYVAWSPAKDTHSSYGLPGAEEKPFAGDREWMIRAVLDRRVPRGRAEVTMLGLDDGVKAGHRSLGGSGHVVELKKPSGTWWIQSVLVYGQRYGGGYDAQSTTFRTAILNPSGRVLCEQEDPYARFDGREFGWVEIPLREPLKAPSKFRVGVDFDPGRTQGVYVGYAASSRPASFTAPLGGDASGFRDGDWMIRVRLVSEKPEPPAAAPETSAPVAAREAKVYLEDFVYLKKTAKEVFPAFEKKGVDWTAVCAEAEPAFASCPDDRTHILNVRRLLAKLGDMHSGVSQTNVDAPGPAFDGLYGAGLWIAVEGDGLVLRALLPGHVLEKEIRPGWRLVAIDGRPAGEVHEEVRQRLRTWSGWSSMHFLDARLSFQFFPFGEKLTLPARFEAPDGRTVDVALPRWGPGGRGLSRAAVTMPPGVEAEGRAVSAKLDGGEIGYVRILGGMNDETRDEFQAAFDALRGAQGVLLDCRGMGGGGDDAAWAMAGRFFTRRTPLRHDPALEPTGDWQFDGPVVMLQDERMVSSAETFTWAMAETDRAVTVGRPTGGATIIPRVFTAPSRLFTFRLGARDRETSVHGVHPEGVGSPPAVYVPYTADLLAKASDPELAVGLDVLRHLLAGAKPQAVVEAYRGALGGDADAAREAAGPLRTRAPRERLALPDLLPD